MPRWAARRKEEQRQGENEDHENAYPLTPLGCFDLMG